MTMKKTYINPEMVIIQMEAHQVLTQSAGISGTPQANEDALSPEFDFDEYY